MLAERIKHDMTAAMKAGDKDKVSCLRVLLAAIKNREKDLRKQLDDQEIIAAIRSEIKQVTESYEQFKGGHREDLAQKEFKNLQILRSYLPTEMNDEEITAIVDAVISETGATKKDLGKIMKIVLAKLAGRADGKKVNVIVSSRLT